MNEAAVGAIEDLKLYLGVTTPSSDACCYMYPDNVVFYYITNTITRQHVNICERCMTPYVLKRLRAMGKFVRIYRGVVSNTCVAKFAVSLNHERVYAHDLSLNS